jgi:ribosomal protein S18
MIAQSVDNQDFGGIAILPKYLDSQERMVSRDILASSIFHQRKSEHLL